MERQCADCPFARSGPGLRLRRSLAPGRWREILAALRADLHFTCHKTTRDAGDGSQLVCAGALDWQAARGLSSNFQRICERLEAMTLNRKGRT